MNEESEDESGEGGGDSKAWKINSDRKENRAEEVASGSNEDGGESSTEVGGASHSEKTEVQLQIPEVQRKKANEDDIESEKESSQKEEAEARTREAFHLITPILMN